MGRKGLCKATPKRGPNRAKGSTLKIACGFSGCRAGADCKNKPFVLLIGDAMAKNCRPLRPQSSRVKFCSQKHLDLCKKVVVKKRGGREALSAEQVVSFFNTLVFKCHKPWAGVLMLLQLFLGDRCDAARQATTAWFTSLQKSATGLPTASIPEVNGKTCSREVPLHPSFAELLWGWMTDKPLSSGKEQWPLKAQDLSSAIAKEDSMFLFCGKSGQGRNLPVLEKPITERAFLKQIACASQSLTRERIAAHRQNKTHLFDDVDMRRVGTHSWKKTAVTLMKEKHTSTSIVSALTGTSAATLTSFYDVPTQKRQRKAVGEVFSPIVRKLASSGATPESETRGYRCHSCSKPATKEWNFCPFCSACLGIS